MVVTMVSVHKVKIKQDKKFIDQIISKFGEEQRRLQSYCFKMIRVLKHQSSPFRQLLERTFSSSS